jgi:high-affinity nickel-transport protein
MVGGVELLQVLAARLSLHGTFWRLLESLDLGRLGYLVVALFVLTWLLSITLWKTRRVEERWSSLLERT